MTVNIHISVLGKRALVIILLNGSSFCVGVGGGRGKRALRGVTSNSQEGVGNGVIKGEGIY